MCKIDLILNLVFLLSQEAPPMDAPADVASAVDAAPTDPPAEAATTQDPSPELEPPAATGTTLCHVQPFL